MKSKILSIILILFACNISGQNIKDCSVCDKKLLTENQLKDKSKEELALLRNEIYARKGYVFENYGYSQYFEEQKWYKPIYDNDKIKLSEIENANVVLIKSLETKIQQKRNLAINDLKKLKAAFNNKDKQFVDDFLKPLKEEGGTSSIYDDTLEYLKKTLNYINLNDINWNNGKGLYRVKIDNGYNISHYEIRIVGNEVTISTGDDSHSENWGDWGDGYSNYMSESEYQVWWVFEMTETGLVPKYIYGAGG